MRTDLKNNISVAQSLLPAERAAAASGTGVDLAGYDAAVVVISAGAAGAADDSFTFEVQHSDDDVDGNYAAVADEFLDGAEPVITQANDNAVYEIGYHGIKRWLRVRITAVAGADPALVASASIIRGKSRKLPK